MVRLPRATTDGSSLSLTLVVAPSPAAIDGCTLSLTLFVSHNPGRVPSPAAIDP